MQSRKYIAGLLMIMACLPMLIQAQEVQRVDSLFFEGVREFNEGNYNNVIQMMELLNKLFPDHPRLTGSLLLQAKANHHLKQYQNAIDLYEHIEYLSPEGAYVDDAMYGKGVSYYELNMYREAVLSFLRVVESSIDKRLMKRAAKLASDIMDYRMNLRDLKELHKEVRGEKARAVVTIRLAQRQMDEAQYQSAKQLLNQYLKRSPNSPYVFQVQQLLSQAERVGKDKVKTGIILPLSGTMEEQGRSLLEGLKYAIQKHNEKNVEPLIEPIIHDSQGKIVPAIIAAQELCQKENVQLIIGELSSDVTSAIAGIAAANETVLLSPTATEEGITAIGPTIYQLNSNISIRAKTLAEYAVNVLGLKRFATLAPVDDYGRVMHQVFSETVKESGGEIIAEAWYYEGTSDFKNQFEKIREKGLKTMLDDSVLFIIPKEDQKLYKSAQGVKYVTQTLPELVDSTDLAVTSIDGFFIPAYSEELELIIPQLAFYHFETQVLGGIPWYNEELLAKNNRYVNGVIFLSDYYSNPYDVKYNQFKDLFRKETRINPEKMEIFGFDTGALLVNVIQDLPVVGTVVIQDRLNKLTAYEGVKGTIRLNEDRVNQAVTLLQFRNGNIVKIQ